MAMALNPDALKKAQQEIAALQVSLGRAQEKTEAYKELNNREIRTATIRDLQRNLYSDTSLAGDLTPKERLGNRFWRTRAAPDFVRTSSS